MDKVVHFEIPVDDLERAKKFYKNVFGWKMGSLPGMEYIMTCTTPVDESYMPKEPGAINGAIMKRQHPIDYPVITIGVQDIDDAMKNIKKMGGEIIREKMQIWNVGYATYFKDTEGNIIGLWQKIG